MKLRNSPLKGLISKVLPEVVVTVKRKKTGVSFATSYHYAKKRQNNCKKCKGKPNCVCKK